MSTVDRILGRGVGFPFAITADGRVALSSGEADVEQAIGLILATAPGERPMRPEFGCGIHDLLFEVMDAPTFGAIQRSVREALARWEPRVDVLGVECRAADASVGLIEVEVAVRIRDTNHIRNLVYPFYSIPEEPGA